jgi:hypothetical protein
MYPLQAFRKQPPVNICTTRLHSPLSRESIVFARPAGQASVVAAAWLDRLNLLASSGCGYLCRSSLEGRWQRCIAVFAMDPLLPRPNAICQFEQTPLCLFISHVVRSIAEGPRSIGPIYGCGLRSFCVNKPGGHENAQLPHLLPTIPEKLGGFVKGFAFHAGVAIFVAS